MSMRIDKKLTTNCEKALIFPGGPLIIKGTTSRTGPPEAGPELAAARTPRADPFEKAAQPCAAEALL